MQELGKLHKKWIDSGVSKAGKDWRKINFVIQKKAANLKQPVFIAFEAFDEGVLNMVNDTSDGTDIKVEYSIECREWNNKWFTSLKAWSVEVHREDYAHNGVNQANQMYGQQPTPPAFDDDDGDGLPF